MALGSAGSARIRSVIQTIIGVVDRGLAARDAVSSPRIHVEGREIEGQGSPRAARYARGGWLVRRWTEQNLYFGGHPGVRAGQLRTRRRARRPRRPATPETFPSTRLNAHVEPGRRNLRQLSNEVLPASPILEAWPSGCPHSMVPSYGWRPPTPICTWPGARASASRPAGRVPRCAAAAAHRGGLELVPPATTTTAAIGVGGPSGSAIPTSTSRPSTRRPEQRARRSPLRLPLRPVLSEPLARNRPLWRSGSPRGCRAGAAGSWRACTMRSSTASRRSRWHCSSSIPTRMPPRPPGTLAGRLRPRDRASRRPSARLGRRWVAPGGALRGARGGRAALGRPRLPARSGAQRSRPVRTCPAGVDRP